MSLQIGVIYNRKLIMAKLKKNKQKSNVKKSPTHVQNKVVWRVRKNVREKVDADSKIKIKEKRKLYTPESLKSFASYT